MHSAHYESTSLPHPIDVIETIAAHRQWTFEREGQDEMNLCISGSFCDYQIALNWRRDLHCLHAACIFELRVATEKQAQIYELVGRINEQLWLGHFDLWVNTGVILHRNTMMVGGELRPKQADGFIDHALIACERFYPAFQYVLWAGRSPQDALVACLFETDGNA